MLTFVQHYPMDCVAFVVLLAFTVGYHIMYYHLVRTYPHRIFKGRINQVRKAWVAKIFEENAGVLAVQTLRNVTMAASFLTTAAVILIGGMISLLLNLDSTRHIFLADSGQVTNPALLLKLTCLIVLFIATLFYFALCVRLLNHVAMLMGAPPDAIRDAVGEDPVTYVYRLHAKAGRHYSFGMRSIFFLIPTVIWFLGPLPCIVVTVAVGLLCIKLDFGQVRLQ